MLFRSPGGPLVSYYAKKGGKLPMANFTDYSGSQMYGKGGFFEFNQKPIIDNTRVKSVIVPKSKQLVLNTPEYYTKKRNQKLISGVLNTGAAVAPPGASSAFDAAGTFYDLGTEGETSPVGFILKNDKKVIDKTAKKIAFKTVPGLGRLWNAYEAYQNLDRKSTRLNSSHIPLSRMPSSA